MPRLGRAEGVERPGPGERLLRREGEQVAQVLAVLRPGGGSLAGGGGPGGGPGGGGPGDGSPGGFRTKGGSSRETKVRW